MCATQIKLIFTVFGKNFFPEEFTKLIAIKPSNTWILGDEVNTYKSYMKNTVRLPRRKESGWEYSSGFMRTLDLDEVSSKFEDLFLEQATIIKDYLNKNNLQSSLSIVIEIANNLVPGLNFSKKLISLIHTLEAEVDIDIYILEKGI